MAVKNGVTLHKRSAVAGKVPDTTALSLGELGINTNDGKLYLKKDDGVEEIVEVGGDALRPGDNVSELTNDAGYITADDIPASGVSSVDGRTGDVTLDDLYADIDHNHDTTYAPIVHTHTESDITDLDKYTQSETDTLLNDKADVVHTHVEADITDLDKYTQSETDTLLDGKADVVHTHVKADITDFNDADYAPVVHGHTESDITDLDKYTQSETDTLLDGKADVVHGHTESDITDLDKYTQAQVDAKDAALQSNIDDKADLVHTHVEADITNLDKYTRTETDNLLSDKANIVHTHVEADITNLDKYTQSETDTLLDGKANVSHTHVKADITDFNDGDYAPVSHTHTESDITDLDKYTQAQVDAKDAALQSNIDGKANISHTHVKANITDFSDSDYATAAQGSLANSATQPGDNVSDLTNDAGYITADDIPASGVTSVDGRTGTVTLDDLYASKSHNHDSTYGRLASANTWTANNLIRGDLYLGGGDSDGVLQFYASDAADGDVNAYRLFTNGTNGELTLGLYPAAGGYEGVLSLGLDRIVDYSFPPRTSTNPTNNSDLTRKQWVDSNFATSAQGSLANSAVQPGDNVSDLTNDAGYITSGAQLDANNIWTGTNVFNDSVTFNDIISNSSLTLSSTDSYKGGFYRWNSASGAPTAATDWIGLVVRGGNTNDSIQLAAAVDTTGDRNLYYRHRANGGNTSWSQLMTTAGGTWGGNHTWTGTNTFNKSVAFSDIVTLPNLEKTNLTKDGDFSFDSSQGLLVYRTQQGYAGAVSVLDGANVDAGNGISISNLNGGTTGTTGFTFSVDESDSFAWTGTNTFKNSLYPWATTSNEYAPGSDKLPIDWKAGLNMGRVDTDSNYPAQYGLILNAKYNNDRGFQINGSGTELHWRGIHSGQTGGTTAGYSPWNEILHTGNTDLGDYGKLASNNTWTGQNTYSGKSQFNVNTSAEFQITATDSSANSNFTAAFIDHNISGSTTLTGDRTHRGLQIDVDSSATGGDTNNEHRVYGIESNVKATGDSDIVYGTYNYVETEHSSGSVSNLRGISNYVVADVRSGGLLSNAHGSYNYAHLPSLATGTVNNMYGSENRVLINGNASNGIGVRAEVELDAGTLTTAKAVDAVIDRDGGTITHGYLFHGDYQGTFPTNAWGMYIPDTCKNLLGGDLNLQGWLRLRQGGTGDEIRMNVSNGILDVYNQTDNTYAEIKANTFSAQLAPTDSDHVTRKDYVDNGFMSLTGDQSITGEKQFDEVRYKPRTVNYGTANQWMTVCYLDGSSVDQQSARLKFSLETVGGGRVVTLDVDARTWGSTDTIAATVKSGRRNPVDVRIWAESGYRLAVQIKSSVVLGTTNVSPHIECNGNVVVSSSFDPSASGLTLHETWIGLQDEIVHTSDLLVDGSSKGAAKLSVEALDDIGTSSAEIEIKSFSRPTLQLTCTDDPASQIKMDGSDGEVVLYADGGFRVGTSYDNKFILCERNEGVNLYYDYKTRFGLREKDIYIYDIVPGEDNYINIYAGYDEDDDVYADAGMEFRCNDTTGRVYHNGFDDTLYLQRSSGTSWTYGVRCGSSSVSLGYGTAARKLVTSNTGVTIYGTVNETSDRRLKSNIKTIDGALDKVGALSGYTFDKADTIGGECKPSAGVIAQEIQAVLPEAVSVVEAETGKDGEPVNDDEILAVSHSALTGLLLESIKELNAKVDAQQKIVDAQQKIIEQLLKDK